MVFPQIHVEIDIIPFFCFLYEISRHALVCLLALCGLCAKVCLEGSCGGGGIAQICD